MSEQNPAPEADTTTPAETQDDQRVPYDRFQKANSKAKEAAARATALEAQVAELQAQMEDREQAGLPELDRIRKEMERVQKRADEAEARAQETEAKLQRSSKERLVTAAAQNFNDPGDAVAFVDLDGIEDERDAERAVKALAKQKPHLLKSEDTKLPGKVLADGQRVQPGQNGTTQPSLADADREFASDMLAQINQLRRDGGFRPGGSF